MVCLFPNNLRMSALNGIDKEPAARHVNQCSLINREGGVKLNAKEALVPSIEIICIGQLNAGGFSHLPFAVESGTELKSHRMPRPLFQEDFAGLKGCIYHLGNPDLKTRRKNRIFFAYDLLGDRVHSAPRSTFLEFRPEFT